MVRGVVIIISVILIFVSKISAQEIENAKSNSKISFGYYLITRHQINDNPVVKLNKDFSYINVFSKQRFAPDEPSSFSYLSYTFKDRNDKVDFYVSIFRNHTKGGFLIENNEEIHFGKGNSQIGLGSGMNYIILDRSLVLKSTVFTGLGPQFTQFTNGLYTINPTSWGIQGFGLLGIFGMSVESPIIFNRWSFELGFKTTYHYSTYKDISTVDIISSEDAEFINYSFSVFGFSPILQINYEFLSKKDN